MGTKFLPSQLTTTLLTTSINMASHVHGSTMHCASGKPAHLLFRHESAQLDSYWPYGHWLPGDSINKRKKNKKIIFCEENIVFFLKGPHNPLGTCYLDTLLFRRVSTVGLILAVWALVTRGFNLIEKKQENRILLKKKKSFCFKGSGNPAHLMFWHESAQLASYWPYGHWLPGFSIK